MVPFPDPLAKATTDVFRRTPTETDSTAPAETSPADQAGRPQGKGRPTPTRKEAEAAARARAKTPRTRKEKSRARKEKSAAQRRERAESSQKMREALKNGDERYLPARDQGPVRRFIRDFVDVRFSFGEVMVPLLIVTLVLGYSGSERLAAVGNTVLMATLLLAVTDLLVLRFRLRRALRKNFPDESLKGTTYYAWMRALQMRFMRLPKPQVKIGQSVSQSGR